VVRDNIRYLNDRVRSKLPAWLGSVLVLSLGSSPRLTSEEQLFRSSQETLLSLGIRYWVEAPHTHDLPDCITTSIVGVGIGAQNTTKVCLQPQIICCLPLFTPLINTVAFHSSWDGDVDTHV
jgi:hypothetical protein